MRGFLLFFCGLCTWHVQAQEADSTQYRYPRLVRHDELTLLAGYQQGRHGFAELGIGRNLYGVNRHPYDLAYYAGAELRVDRPELWGVKLACYAEGGSAFGVQLIEYFQGSDRCTVFRPEFGIGIFKFKMTYAYNARLTKPQMEGINTHMISLSYAFRLKKLKGDDDRGARQPF